MATRHVFDENLRQLHLDVVRMASLVEKSIEEAIHALKQKDKELAQRVIEQDDQIDEMERTIETKCIKLIATQQPIAKDLRLITSILKMITDLERIADHSADISELILQIADEEYIKPLIDIPKMAKTAREMVKNAIDAYINNDVAAAQQVCMKDKEVDDYFELIVDDLQQLMRKNPQCINQATIFILIVKYIEKIADHATNIGEWVIYIITGQHESLNG
ncbi:phosphate signaling complex protein PhoU [Petroclostridium sp. X23]|uniref:phosphate signaling complex protein PhoU n=1 Tax=Petroclostridium sp. X23 TaxID=3045146 RepID=UPI0024ACBE22|nr:phosphate signaling complex protein PhoU [Petroclostridium sp. X23]WHH57643.1 phosphate signaling complex protein PhoU [Petroclostridium sp. X23]